jgi:hypothetical protein
VIFAYRCAKWRAAAVQHLFSASGFLFRIAKSYRKLLI